MEIHHNMRKDRVLIGNTYKELVDYLEDEVPYLFKKKKDMDIAYSILELFKRSNDQTGLSVGPGKLAHTALDRFKNTLSCNVNDLSDCGCP